MLEVGLAARDAEYDLELQARYVVFIAAEADLGPDVVLQIGRAHV